MEQPNKLDKSILDLVNELLGGAGIKLYGLLKEKENVSEFDLSEQMGMGINQVRSLLYKLSSYNLVYSTRKKDRQKGWYVYYWTFNMKYTKDFLIMKGKEKIEKLTKRLKKEKETQFYICPNKCIRLELSEAMEYDFKCPECEKILNYEDNSKEITNIEKDIETLKEDIKELEQCVVPELPSEKTMRRKEARAKKALERKKAMIKKAKERERARKKKAGKKKQKPAKKKFFKKKVGKKKAKFKPHKKFAKHGFKKREKKHHFKPKAPKKQKPAKHQKVKKHENKNRQKKQKKPFHKKPFVKKSLGKNQHKPVHTIPHHAPPSTQHAPAKKGGIFRKLKKIRF
jgi:transcription initiation factor TFIIE subunit alpha